MNAIEERESNEMKRKEKDWEHIALVYAESIGIYEYEINDHFMEYWSFYGNEGWYFIKYDLEDGKEVFRGANIPWEGLIPKFLLTESGSTKYNYLVG